MTHITGHLQAVPWVILNASPNNFAFLESLAIPRHLGSVGVGEMDYEIDLDPKHSVIRLTVRAETVTLELLEKIYRHVSEVTSSGGPYASIYDISAVKWTALPTETFKSVLPRRPLIPMIRKQVLVGKEPDISRFASLFHMCTESIGEPAGFILTYVYDTGEIREFQVVYSLDQAYDIVGARPEDFILVFRESTQPERSRRPPLGMGEMDYKIDLDPVHSVIRLTVTAETFDLELLEKTYRHLSEVSSHGGPYAAIYDLSAVKHIWFPTDMVRSLASRSPSIPMGREHVIVGKEPHISRLACLFQMCYESIGEPAGFVLGRVYDSGEIREYRVVYSLEDAYDIVGARPEDFKECLAWPPAEVR